MQFDIGNRLVIAKFFKKLFQISAYKKVPVSTTFKAETGIFGPSAEIRTRGLLNPIQARYQTSPHPESNNLLTAWVF